MPQQPLTTLGLLVIPAALLAWVGFVAQAYMDALQAFPSWLFVMLSTSPLATLLFGITKRIWQLGNPPEVADYGETELAVRNLRSLAGFYLGWLACLVLLIQGVTVLNSYPANGMPTLVYLSFGVVWTASIPTVFGGGFGLAAHTAWMTFELAAKHMNMVVAALIGFVVLGLTIALLVLSFIGVGLALGASA